MRTKRQIADLLERGLQVPNVTVDRFGRVFEPDGNGGYLVTISGLALLGLYDGDIMKTGEQWTRRHSEEVAVNAHVADENGLQERDIANTHSWCAYKLNIRLSSEYYLHDLSRFRELTPQEIIAALRRDPA